MKELWKEHPLYVAGKVEEVPTEWVWQFYGRDVSPRTNLKDGSMVEMHELWENLTHEGMHDPLIMRVGVKNKKFRLESGNHRIQLFHEHGIPTIPLTVQIREECGPHTGDVMTDATHNFDFEEPLRLQNINEEYVRPSQVFTIPLN